MSRAAGFFLLIAASCCIGAFATGAFLVGPFRSLLEEGAGAAEVFSRSVAVRVHAWLGAVAAGACLPVAATGLLLGLHGLLVPRGPRVRAALLCAVSPVLLFFGLGAAYTGHAAWEATRLGELQADLLHGFLRAHAVLFGGGLAAGLLVQALALSWWKRAERRSSPDTDEI